MIQIDSDKFGLWKLVENKSESFRCDSDRFRPSIDLKNTFSCDSDRFRLLKLVEYIYDVIQIDSDFILLWSVIQKYSEVWIFLNQHWMLFRKFQNDSDGFRLIQK